MYSEVPPTSMARGGFPSVMLARTVLRGLGMGAARCLTEQPFFLQLLAIDAVRRPGDGEQALFADRGAAVGADAVGLVAHAREGFFDQHQQVALAVGQREVELFRIGAGGFVGEILDPDRKSVV